ncbi:hypothetical protein H8R18_05150 [Nanchangia anserum]|uniref:Uncharacterized protein n=1 Tax=Nanchangia anserum TaxID=2692125 RepID=A0A8I0GB55_9ACTO|nr:PPA1309 family protein [Nanchangia anserum]MBD3688930.1 hypothetical protein [Nanchangia anserum]QOX81196.1 hypothetical protein H8R18_05150 [Nanchangia anserum]
MSNPSSALRHCVREIDTYTRTLGWDRPIMLFALVPTAELVGDIDVGAEGTDHLTEALARDPESLSAIIQDGLTASLEELAATVYFPPAVAGAAIVIERLSLPPEAEADLPEDPAAQADWVAHHPLRQDIRIIAARTRSGEAWAAIRGRGYDDPDALIEGADLAPELTDVLGHMLGDQDEH